METINYALTGVSIEQFATLFEPSSANIQVNLNIPIRSNYGEHTIAVGANIQFSAEDKPFLIAEVLCHFIIEDESWDILTENKTLDAVLQRWLVKNLVSIAINTSRGALCAKTENTPFSKYVLPILELQDDQGEDVIIPVSSGCKE